MIRNAWHIAGGEGQAANSSNRRVRASDSNGKSSVVVVERDIGIKSNDDNEIIRQLQLQGLDVKGVDLRGSVEEGGYGPNSGVPIMSSGGGIGSGRLPYINNRSNGSRSNSQNNNRSNSRSNSDSGPATNTTTTTTIVSPPTLPKGSKPQSLNTLGGTTSKEAVAAFKEPELPNPLVEKLQERLKKRGVKGFVSMQRVFRNMDDDNNKQLDKAEFKKGMKEIRMKITDIECNSLFQYFDKDGSGTIDFDEFMLGVRGSMNSHRRKFVNMAFDLMDKDGKCC